MWYLGFLYQYLTGSESARRGVGAAGSGAARSVCWGLTSLGKDGKPVVYPEKEMTQHTTDFESRLHHEGRWTKVTIIFRLYLPKMEAVGMNIDELTPGREDHRHVNIVGKELIAGVLDFVVCRITLRMGYAQMPAGF